MLQKLQISNYAIIDQLSIIPDAHLNTITGETGAGKSIIMGALSLILGERADTSVLINKEQKCVVEALFGVAAIPAFHEAIARHELDEGEEGRCTIRREISASGKSRAFINDTPVTLPVLNEITSLLVDLQQQFGHLTLEDDAFQMAVIDAMAGSSPALQPYQALFARYRDILKSLDRLQAQRAQWQTQADYQLFLLKELEEAAFQEAEIETAEQRLKQLTHAERILSVLAGARMGLTEGELPMLPELRRITQQIQSIGEVMPEAATLQTRLSGAYEELKDIASELVALEEKINLDPELMSHLQARVDLGYRLMKKHGVRTTEELRKIHDQLNAALKSSNGQTAEIDRLTVERDEVFKRVMDSATALRAQRQAACAPIATRINELLQLVGMPNARIRIAMHPLPQPDAKGIDRIVFELDANKSGQYLPVHKAASGGEMSRIMLCIKSMTAQAMHLPTLIFDEVDTGISGEAARQVGQLLRDLSAHHQIICITHQPQVAARGTKHFFVYKDEGEQGRIHTRVRQLTPEERIQAIARMIGGEQPGAAALQHARELIE